ncbi:MAG: Gfo/Idh/MocA family oxidoreductase [Armatimonadia bacterium]
MAINVALVGLGFGAEFTPIYLHHPGVASVTICDADEAKLAAHGDKYGVADRCGSLDEVLQRNDIDAVHLVSPIPLHAEQTLAVLNSGKHCACTVPMATRLDDLRAIIAAQRASGKNYMMMETAVYCREFLYAQELVQRGELGKPQFLRGAHCQDMEGWPPYWLGLPPMWYATHAIAPLLRLAATRVERVHCFGSGTMREELTEQYGNPYPAESAIFRLAGSEVAAEVTRTLFHVGRQYQESFNVYAENGCFEWGQTAADHPVVFRMTPLDASLSGRGGRAVTAERVECPDYAHRLPEPIQRFTRRGVYDESTPHLSFLQGGGHGGSHPHLVHEFVSSIVEGRKPAIDAVTAADWTVAGICAHESAMNGGEAVEVPEFG